MRQTGPNFFLQPSTNTFEMKAVASVCGKLPGRFIFAALLAGLLLLVSAPWARADQNPPGCTGSALGIVLYTDAPDVHIGDTLNYSILVFNGTDTGPVVCNATSIQAFVVTPDGVSHTIALTNTSLTSGQKNFYSNIVSYVVRAQDILPNQTVAATASDEGVIHQNINNSEGGGNQGVNTQVSLPCILLTMQCFGGVGQGAPITFTGTVTNCGNDTLVDVTVTNFDDAGQQTRVAFMTNILAGQVASFSGSWIPLTPCNPSTVTLTVQAVDQFTTYPKTVTSSVTNTCSETLTEGIVVTKTCPVAPVAPGQLLTFSGSVSNTGNVTLTNIIVVNNQPSPNTTVFTLASLAPGVVADFTGSYTAPASCSVSDTLAASAATICGVAVNDSVSATCPIITTPQIAVTQNCPVNPVLPGGLLTYSGAVSNPGDIMLTNVVVLNNLTGSTPVFTAVMLPPGAVSNFTGSYLAATDCSSTSTSTATAQSICGVAVSNAASSICPITSTPVLAITQACPVNPVIPGGLLTYSGTVSNAGNSTITNVVVLNNLSGPTPVFTAATMAPGAAANFTGSYLVAADCSSASTSTATGRSVCGVAVTSSASTTCPITTTPVLAVTEVCPVIPPIPGGLLTYSGTVKNTGNVTITNVVVLNTLSGSTPILSVDTLAPGAVANFTGSYVAPADCSSTSTLTATGQSICGVPVVNAASATCPISTVSQIAITQTCPPITTVPGELLTYSGTVSNAGNILLTNVVVLNNRSGSSPVFTAASMEPGVVSNFTGSYLAPAICSDPSTSTATAQSICGVAVTNAATTTCPIGTTPILVVTEVCPVIPAIPGALLTYSGTVSNAGNITLTNVIVLNNLSGSTAIFTTATLAPGVGASFTGSFLAPADCSVTSTTTATGRSICGVSVTNAASATCPIATTPVLAVTEVCPVIPVIPGGLLTYSGTVKNTGNVTITNVVVLNTLSGSTPILSVATLAPGAVANFTGSYLAPTDACSSTSTSTATAQSICGVAVTNSASATCPIVTIPIIAVTQFCPVNPVMPGEVVTYTGTVSNAGNIELNNVEVLNNLSGSTPVFTAASLLPGAVAAYTGSYIAPANCSVPSTSTATGLSLCGVSVTNSASATCSISTTPLIAVTLACPVNPVNSGGLLTYTGTVSNSGNITLTNVVVLDNMSGTTPVFTMATLAPGAVADFSGSYKATTECSSASTATATGRSTCGVAVSSTASTTCPILTTPAIVVMQFCPADLPLPGGVLTYTGIVSNAGNILLTNIIVVDNRPASNTVIFTAAALAVGATTNFTGSYAVPLNCCTVWNTLEASGQGCSGAPVTNESTVTCNVLTVPTIVVTKECLSGLLKPGDLLTYGGTVSNSGNIALINVIVVDNEPSINSPVLGPITLAPGEVANYNGSYIVPPDFCGGDTVTAIGTDICGFVTTSNKMTTICPITTAPAINVTKNCPLLPTPRGGVYTYTGSVSNTGNVTLVKVFVVDNQPTNNTPVIGPITLTPGASVNFTNSYTAPSCCCFILDILTANGLDNCSGVNVTATGGAECPLLATPLISVAEQCPAGTVPVGGLYEFTGSVINIGEVVLTNVNVYSSLPVSNTLVLGPVDLAPGQSQQFTASFTVSAGEGALTVTAFGQDTCQGAIATASANCAGSIGELSIAPAPGAYNGLFFVPGNIQNTSSGSFTFTLAAKGAYTASLSSLGVKYSTSGKLSPDGKATNHLTLPRTNALTVMWEVLLDGSDTVSGTVNNSQWVSGLTGYRAAFDARTNPAPQMGRYTLVIPGAPGASNLPTGDGYGTFTIAGGGVVTFAGTLADGTVVAQSVAISKSGQWPLFVSLQAGGGSLLGWMQFADNPNDDVSGQLNWFRPAIKTSRLYPGGFAMTSAAGGSLYHAPVGKTSRVLQITNGLDILFGGDLPGTVTNAVTLEPPSKVVNDGSNKLTHTFALPTGRFTGTLVDAVTKQHVTFNGVVQQKANYASGYFLGTNQSGRVVLSPAQ